MAGQRGGVSAEPDIAPPAAAPGEPLSPRLDGFSLPESYRPLRRLRRRSGFRLVGAYLLTVFLLVSLNFFLPRAMPGDPITALTDPGASSYVSDEVVRSKLEAYYGLDRPLMTQYAAYLRGLAQGDLGVSIRYNAPVSALMSERLPWTLLLVLSSMAIAVVVGWTSGVHSGWRRGRPADRGLLSAFLTLHSFPEFFLGSLALFVFSVKLGWFPLAGAETPFNQSAGLLSRLLDIGHHLALPAGVLGLNFATSQYLVMRAGMVGEAGSDYLLLGRVKGLRERRVKYRYAARNALLPVVTLTAVHVGFAVTGSILVETVFAYQGVGRLLFDSVSFRDYPALQACFLVLTLVVLTCNFLADALYSQLDPRTRT